MTTMAAKSEILVVEAEAPLRRLLRFAFEDAGYAVREAEDGHRGLVEAAHRHPAAIILDLDLPDMEGLDMLRRLREWCDLPVLALSAQADERSKIAGLDAGADDYVTKPFGAGELLARLRALLRRVHSTDRTGKVTFGAIEVDLVGRRVTKAGRTVKLTAREYALLRLLATHHDKVLTHRQILTELWGPKAERQTHYLRVFMMRLRRKIETDPDQPAHLQTQSGVGYRLATGP